MAVAEDARRANAQAVDVWVAMDARMDEVYAAHYRHVDEQWIVRREPALYTLDALNTLWRAHAPLHVAGSAVDAFADRLELAGAATSPGARPTAVAMLPLAQALWMQGGAVDAAQALPLYLRDKVALTTAERELVKAAKEAGRVT
jgi:tRNA threonylcarbamoyladenosine biosynthesis protein TsaB